MERGTIIRRTIIKCHDTTCKCVIEILQSAGWKFEPGVWTPPGVELRIEDSYLVVEIVHDVGTGIIRIPMDTLRVDLGRCL